MHVLNNARTCTEVFEFLFLDAFYYLVAGI